MEKPAHTMVARAGFFVIALCVLLTVFFAGWIVAGMRLRADTPIVIRPDTRDKEPTVVVEGIVNGILMLRTAGDVRIVAGDDILVPDADGLVQMKDKKLLTNRIEVLIPEGMQFVGSKRGQKYYAVDSSSAQTIAPENRIYFKTAQEAEAAGYRP